MPQNDPVLEDELESENDNDNEAEIGEADSKSDDEAISVGDIKSDLSDISDKIIAHEKLLLMQENEEDKEFIRERIKNLKRLLEVLELA